MIYLNLFLVFFKIGLFTIGGGLAMLPLIEREAISHAWMTYEEFINMIAISQSTPGPIGINMATYVGYTNAHVIGAIIATLGMITPSLIIIIIIAHYFMKFNEEPIVQSAFYGLRPAVTGLIAVAGFNVAKVSIFNFTEFLKTHRVTDFFQLKACLLFIVILYVSNKWKKHPIVFIVISAVVGIVFKF
ncbi:chromate transporter [Clostridium sp. DL1XJH146]